MKESKTEIEVQKLYSEFTRRKITFIFFLSLLLGVTAVIAVNIGSVSLEIGKVLCSIFNRIFSTNFNSEELTSTIVWELRLPRISMGIVVGMGLAMAGAAMQGIVKNPLASPYTLGVASAAGFGAALAIIAGVGFLGATNLWIVTNAFLFALLSSFLILGLTKLKRATPETLILAGVAMMFLFSAMTSLLQYMGTEEGVTAVVFWLLGNLSKATWPKVGAVSIVVFGTLPLFMKYAWDFNSLTAGDETAKSLGVNTERVRLVGLALASLVTAGAICFVGTIGFIGLASPHISRMIIGGDHRFLLPTSCLMGAVLLLAADTAAKTILSPLILPVGILTSFLGVPLFVYLIMKRRKEYW
ncbi:MAG: iron ABC transporter permease [Candidatus Aerophobetes bacterium]|nr:iron ABC transporter permease [Candidatus Aerophobetes bacterium]